MVREAGPAQVVEGEVVAGKGVLKGGAKAFIQNSPIILLRLAERMAKRLLLLLS